YPTPMGRPPTFLSQVKVNPEREVQAMSAHLFILYPVPQDTKKFDRAYREEHLPYAGPKLVGATGVTTKRVVGPVSKAPPVVCNAPAMDVAAAVRAFTRRQDVSHRELAKALRPASQRERD